jgi:amidophosphoribosyltransferase
VCGVFGIRSEERDVARLTYFGLFALQHRGQESAGIAVSDSGRLTVLREMGLVAQVFREEHLQALPGEVAVGHTRYSTTGSSQWENAQPVIHSGAARQVALGHNGNLVNAEELRAELRSDGVGLASTSDTEVIAAMIARDPSPLPDAVAATMGRLEGAYSVAALAEEKLVAFRDPHGIRPLSLGRIGDDWVVASETCALDLVGADWVRDVRPGEVVWVDADGLHTAQVLPEGRGALCIFEHVYFARPDSTLAGTEVHGARVRMGERLATEAPADADLVMPIPDSGTPAAIGFSKASGIPFQEGLIKNRYVGRTFIQPDQGLRQQGIKLKFNPLDEVAGRRIVIVDDSIVRGNTMRQLVSMLFDAGAAEVHVRVSSPPVVSPCFYGIDMGDDDQIVAAHRSVEQMCDYIGATSLHYLSVPEMQAATRLPEGSVCRACFTRSYPTRVPSERNLAKLRFERVVGAKAGYPLARIPVAHDP